MWISSLRHIEWIHNPIINRNKKKGSNHLIPVIRLNDSS